MPEVHWGYDFWCWKSLDAMLAAFNATGPWRWELGDSDVYGFYLRCRPHPSARIRVFNETEFRTPGAVSSSYWAELYSEPEVRPEIDQQFRQLLKAVEATDITES